jgi:hypothetical protein
LPKSWGSRADSPAYHPSHSRALRALKARLDMRVLFTDINRPGEIDRLNPARRILELRFKVQLPIASGRVRLDATICLHFLSKPYRLSTLVRSTREQSGAWS